MKNVVVVRQESNWEDDGGDHDPCLITVSDVDFAFLEECANGDEADSDTMETVDAIVAAAKRPALPTQVDGVFNIWHCYG